ncbi:MAG: hypothetical protein H6Q59_1631 [Firmicutes bacterium]|nr:hypothetical protein [Bacillota bacterium]
MKISCDVAEDLMPLVKDRIAREGSVHLLNEHMLECPACKALFEEQNFLQNKSSTPQLVKLKRILFTAAAVLMMIGGLLGYFSSSANTPMPIMLVFVGLLSLLPLAIILKKGKQDSIKRFFYGKAVGTIILFGLLGIYLLLHHVFGLF